MAITSGGSDTPGKRPLRFICPNKNCPSSQKTNPLHGKQGTHASPEEVLTCMARGLKDQGYKQISKREFENPTTGAILTLAKHPARSKTGKGNRAMRNKSGVTIW